MRLQKFKYFAGESWIGIFLSLGIHAAFVASIILYKVIWPEIERSSSVEIEIVENRAGIAEVYSNSPKILSALSEVQTEPEKEHPGSQEVMEAPVAENAAAGTGNIQSNEPEGAGSGNVPLPSTEGNDVLNVQGLELDKSGWGNTEFSGGNGNAEGTGKGVFIATGFGGYPGTIGSLPRLPFVPRQVLEVVPEKEDDNTEGEIDLILRIGTDGSVKEHKVNSNTTNSFRYLNNVIKAAYKSRWEAVTYKGDKVEYWVEKKYSFK